MLIPKKVKKAWEEEIKLSGLSILADQATCDHRTIKKALETNECRLYTYNKLNKAVLQLRSNRASDPILKELIEK